MNARRPWRALWIVTSLAISGCGGGAVAGFGEALTIGAPTLSREGVGARSPVQLTAGARHNCVLLAAGEVWCWGQNNRGQLGGRPSRLSVRAHRVEDVIEATHVSAGASHTCAVCRGGEVWCWGDDSFGQLGRGVSMGGISAPGPVEGLRDAVMVSAGAVHTCALRRNAQLWCWGDNEHGQLGNGSILAAERPTRARGLEGREVVRVSAGASHTCALTRDGEPWCWGSNGGGQLGDGTQLLRPLPRQVEWPEAATAVGIDAAPGRHTCALRSNGLVFCWGENDTAQLGTGSVDWRLLPAIAIDVEDARQVVVGAQHSCARLDSGSVRCWGDNTYGQLGTHSVESAASAKDVWDMDDAAWIGAGDYHTCALTRARRVWCWGDNAFGQGGVEGGGDYLLEPTRIDALPEP